MVGIKMNWKVLILIVVISFLTACGETTHPLDEQNEKSSSELKEREKTEQRTEDTLETEDSFILPTTELQKMDKGQKVQELQEALITIGYTIPADGVYSEVTTWAITDFQLQVDNLYGTGVFDEETRLELERILAADKTVEEGIGLAPLAEPVVTDSGSEVLENPYDLLAVVNKTQALPEDYEPVDLIIPDVSFPFEEDLPKKQLRAPAADALEELFEEALAAGHQLYAQSGYRPYERQQILFESYSNEHGEEEANIFSARPGESEHQSGLSMDITSEAVNFELTTDFGKTPEGIWVSDHAHQFGFIIRYPEGKEAITEYQYEPWHLRYVGVRAAKEIKENELTLEEYITDFEAE